jgi:hypothetical protein
MLGGAVQSPTPGAEGLVLGDREAGRVYVASAGVAMVEVVPGAMVFRMVTPPLGVGGSASAASITAREGR